MDLWFYPETWISLLTLTLLELVLGVDNLVFLTIVTGRLPKNKQKIARQIGLSLACIMRLFLLAMAVWLVKLTTPLFFLFSQGISVRDLTLIGGGLFLMVKGTNEIHAGVMGEEFHPRHRRRTLSFWMAITQVITLDMVFSFDSVITAVGLTQEFLIMAIAIIIAVLAMILASEKLSDLINRYPSLKILALSFLLLVGTVLVADGVGFHIPRAYLYFAMAFSIFVEVLNIYSAQKKQN